ncbi:Tricarboxylate transport protein TctC [Grimontia sp. AD028]|uniref:tripartite tricarboxylate transporter substrate binding protein n=1 Tax=unclassified Grimontia TaxID=2644349 RepID=UPI00061A9DB3|nr:MULTISPECIES: tripartite tricarboxylate transporter substrate binding protein [unclassified Grimontia]KKD61822.1 Tricarboxylate transport protein TctC [Grimontia sp. AD028]
MKYLFATLFAVLSIVASFTQAAEWPKKTIKLTVGYGAGGTTDTVSRVLSTELEKSLGKKVTVINKPGGGGSVAAALSKAQRPDGYSIFTLTTGAAVLSPHMQNLPYDPLNDFSFISQIAQWNLGIVAPKDAPYSSIQELVEYVKQHPGEVSYAIAGAGTPQHLAMERLAQQESLNWKAIPFKGGAASVTALLGGHVDLMAGATEWLPQVRSGEFKLLSIITDKRMAEFPNVPTLIDAGYDISAPSILGIAGPKGIPDEVVEKLASAIQVATESGDFKEIIEKLAMQVNYLDAKKFEKNVTETFHKQGEIIQLSGLGK